MTTSCTPLDACPVCDGKLHHWRTKTEKGTEYPMDECNECEFCFVNPRPTFEFLMDFYSETGHGDTERDKSITLTTVLEKEEKNPNSSIDAKRIISAISALNGGVAGRFLDVGCGYGFFSREAKAQGFDIFPLELAQKERDIASEMTGRAPVATSFEAFEHAPGEFSAILMSQILEHVLDVNVWLEKAHQLLEPNGVIAIALPNFDSIFRKVFQEKEVFIIPPAHLNYFGPKNLSMLLEKHGFFVEKTEWISRMPNQGIKRRLPGPTKVLAPVFAALAKACFAAIDSLKGGMIITVYARKR